MAYICVRASVLQITPSEKRLKEDALSSASGQLKKFSLFFFLTLRIQFVTIPVPNMVTRMGNGALLIVQIVH